jgi:hypothetical protein
MNIPKGVSRPLHLNCTCTKNLVLWYSTPLSTIFQLYLEEEEEEEKRRRIRRRR